MPGEFISGITMEQTKAMNQQLVICQRRNFKHKTGAISQKETLTACRRAHIKLR
jgi:hypothetical protein